MAIHQTDPNRWRELMRNKLSALPARYCAVSIADQQLHCILNDTISQSFPISTGANGSGNKNGSGKTPIGLHRIIQKIGHQAPPYTIFTDRINTGTLWTPACTGDCILSRILRLDGCEPGINRGKEIDTFERYIYIHGTSHEADIGTPRSHGCITMRNADIITLFDLLSEGDFVIIN